MIDELKSFLDNILYSKRAPVLAPLRKELLTQSDSEIFSEAVSSLIDAFENAKGDFNKKMLLLPPHWRVVNTLFTLDHQVCNGGFHQFFTNTAGAFDEILLDDLSELGESEFIPIVESALQDYKGIDYRSQWRNLGKSWDVFAEPNREGRFQSDNKAYYKIHPRMTEQIGKYIRNHGDLFTNEHAAG